MAEAARKLYAARHEELRQIAAKDTATRTGARAGCAYVSALGRVYFHPPIERDRSEPCARHSL
jgi:hypothetical protein